MFEADEESLLKLLKVRHRHPSLLENATFELLSNHPNKTINVCPDGPKILVLPNVSDILYCYTRDQWVDKLWSDLHLSAFHYPIIVLNILIFLFGTTGNIFVCLSVYQNYQLRDVTNYFIVNLAFADFLVILICLPATVVWDLSLTWFFGTIPCKLIMFLQDVSISVSVLTLTAISIDRYYAICHPLRFKSSLNQAKNVIVVIWIVSLIIMAPDLIYLSAKESQELSEAGLDTVLYSDCNYDLSESSSKIFQFIKTIILYLVPFVLMFCAHFKILQTLREASAQAYDKMKSFDEEAEEEEAEVEEAAGEEEKKKKRIKIEVQVDKEQRFMFNNNSNQILNCQRFNDNNKPVRSNRSNQSRGLTNNCQRFFRSCQIAQMPTLSRFRGHSEHNGANELQTLSNNPVGHQLGGQTEQVTLNCDIKSLEHALAESAPNEPSILQKATAESRHIRFQQQQRQFNTDLDSHPIEAGERHSYRKHHRTTKSLSETDNFSPKNEHLGKPDKLGQADKNTKASLSHPDQTSKPPGRGIARQITRSSQQSSQFLVTMHNKAKLESRRTASKMLTAIVVLFGICYLPVHLINFLRQFMDHIPQTDLTSTISMLSHCICYLNSAINPIIYNYMNSIFREEFRKFLSCFSRRSKRLVVADTNKLNREISTSRTQQWALKVTENNGTFAACSNDSATKFTRLAPTGQVTDPNSMVNKGTLKVELKVDESLQNNSQVDELAGSIGQIERSSSSVSNESTATIKRPDEAGAKGEMLSLTKWQLEEQMLQQSSNSKQGETSQTEELAVSKQLDTQSPVIEMAACYPAAPASATLGIGT